MLSLSGFDFHFHPEIETDQGRIFLFSGQKIMKVEEFLAIFSQAKKDKDVGNVEDFKECLKLYDKNEDGTMIYDELKHILASMGKLSFFWD